MTNRTVDQAAEFYGFQREMLREEFGELLRHKREMKSTISQKVTIQKMASKIGVHHSQISRWERGDALPKDYATIIAVIECYGLNTKEASELIFLCSLSESIKNILTNNLTLVAKTLDSISQARVNRRGVDISEILNHLEVWTNMMSTEIVYPPSILQEISLKIKSELIAQSYTKTDTKGATWENSYLGDYKYSLTEVIAWKPDYKYIRDLAKRYNIDLLRFKSAYLQFKAEEQANSHLTFIQFLQIYQQGVYQN